MAKYDPLRDHLRRCGQPEQVMTFADIERVIDDSLPRTSNLPAWWGNESSPETRHVQCRSWLDAGYEARLLPAGGQVRFTRASAAF